VKRFRSFYHRLLDANRALGIRRLLWVAPQWLLRQEYLVLVKDLRLPLPGIPANESLRWTPLTESQIDQVLAINPALSEAEIRRRLKEGQECLLAWIGKSPVHYRWDATASPYLPYLGKTLRFLEGDIFATDAFTHPAYRGRGIQTASSIMALHRARDLGLSRFITMPAWWNAPSLRVNLQKTGRSVAGTVGFWNAGLRRYYFTTGDVYLDDRRDIHLRPQKRLESSHSLGRIK
jgi:GNAT superfamily N-acetyltransferase